MSKPDPDDFEAVRAIVTALQPFQRDDQERILRWAREKIGISAAPPAAPAIPPAPSVAAPGTATASGASDIKSFIAQKSPQSDTHFAAAVAYYYQFQAPEAQRKDSITSADLLEACRQAGRARFK